MESERETLETALQSYKASKGFYPPDNQLSPTIPYFNPLFYELTGTTNSQVMLAGQLVPDRFFSLVNSDVLPVATIAAVFGTGSGGYAGFANASTDPSQVQNYLPSTAKSLRTGTFVTNGVSVTLFGVPVPGPIQLPVKSGGTINPWNYVSTNPTNNGASGGYDLWMDVYYSHHTNRVNNWSQNPPVIEP